MESYSCAEEKGPGAGNVAVLWEKLGLVTAHIRKVCEGREPLLLLTSFTLFNFCKTTSREWTQYI